MDPERIQVARVVDVTEAEGPGRRTAIWLQGCSVRCPGCFNPHLWASVPALAEDTTTVVDDILTRAQREGVEGLTLLGGEPFDQAAPLAFLAAGAQAVSLGVMVFTGYRLSNLRNWSRDRSDLGTLLRHTDLLVDGPYLRDRPEPQRPWVGSTNQGLQHLSRRYHGLGAVRDMIELRISKDGSISANGWATDDQLDRLLSGLGARQDRPSDRDGPREPPSVQAPRRSGPDKSQPSS